MHTPGADEPGQGLGGAAKQVTEHAKALVGLEVELATLELKRKVAALGFGIAMLVAAATFALYALAFLLATVAAAFDAFLPRWLALLLVAVILLALAGVLALVGLRAVRRGTPPTPEQAIHEAKLTTSALRSDGGG